MDTRTLKIGQDVYMVSGGYANNGKVVEITSSGVVVRTAHNELMRFDVNGKACDSSDIYKGNLYWGQNSSIPGTHECGPWELDDTHPDELAMLLAHRAKSSR